MPNESQASREAKNETRRVMRHEGGILPAQQIRCLLERDGIGAPGGISEEQIQPASFDLRLGSTAYRVRASFLPGPDAKVLDRIRDFRMHEISLERDAVLERGCVYIVPLMENLRLPSGIHGVANPKSSIGRLDIFTRLIADEASLFDHVAPGYEGPLFVEIAPRTFSIVVRQGTRLNQLRFLSGEPSAGGLPWGWPEQTPPVVDREQARAHPDHRSVAVTVDLRGSDSGIIGYRARRHADLIDLALVDHYEPLAFWEPVRAEGRDIVTLDPGEFYILASKEAVTVPPDHAAEMRAYDTQVGEFRVHYAGFFDPGFGCGECDGDGSRAVLEIRSFEVPFVLRHGQLVGRLVYERMMAIPNKLYGPAIGSSYQRQGLTLAKQFKRLS